MLGNPATTPPSVIMMAPRGKGSAPWERQRRTAGNRQYRPPRRRGRPAAGEPHSDKHQPPQSSPRSAAATGGVHHSPDVGHHDNTLRKENQRPGGTKKKDGQSAQHSHPAGTSSRQSVDRTPTRTSRPGAGLT